MSAEHTEAGRMKRWARKLAVRIPILTLAGLVVGVVALSGTIRAEKERLVQEKKEAVATERPPANVVLLEVAPEVIKDRINLPGVIEPWERLRVMSKVHGTVVETPVQEGDRVVAGQVIARLDPVDFRIALDVARATFELAEADRGRFAALYAKGIVPKADLENLDARVKTSRAALENAELMLSRCTITAPISGMVRRLDAKVGLLLNVSDPVAEILQIDRVKAVVGIPESDVALAQAIREVALTVQALGDREFVGRTHYLASSPENGARLYRLELEVANGDGTLLPGMFLRAQVVKKVLRDAVAVPLYTVIKRQDRQYVYVEEGGQARQVSVELGVIEDWRVQVTRGLSAGSRVVVEGHRDLEPGRKLNVVRVIDDPREASL